MEDEIISVIVPMYNTERHLAACLDSIVSQSYKLLEIIIINDGTTDFCLEIAQKYAESDDRIHIYSYENEGLAEARNRGLAVATGKYVSFVDSDDVLLPRALEVMHKMIKKHEADIVEGRTIRGKVHGDIPVIKKFPYQEFTSEEAIKDMLYQKKLLPSAWAKLYKRILFKDLKFEKGIYYEDLNLTYLLFERASKIIWIDFPVYFYRDTEGSILNTWSNRRLDVLKVTENIEKHMDENHPSLIEAARDRRLSANFNMFALCSIHGEKEKAVECWDIIRKYRKRSLFSRQTRNKNRVGILLSYLGKKVFTTISRTVYNK